MASVPNMRAAPNPAPAGKSRTAPADPAGFAKKLAAIPEELVRIAAATLCGDGDSTAPEGAADEEKDANAAPADAPTDAAQLAALMPAPQPLPQIQAAPIAGPEAAPKVEANATPAIMLPAAAKTAGEKAAPQPEQTDAGADPDQPKAAPTIEASAREAAAATRRAIEAALRAAGPALAEAAPKLAQPAARLIESALQAAGKGRQAPAIADAASAGTDPGVSTILAMPAAPAAATAPAQPRDTAAPAPARALDLANDAAWLDRLARDIAQAAGNEGTIRFRLHPQTLGHLQVELSQGEHGTSIRLTADTEQARAILADAQPRLAAEARAQGVRIAETHVDLSGSDRQAGDPRRQDDARQTPMIRTARDAAADADAPARPGRAKSDRYA